MYRNKFFAILSTAMMLIVVALTLVSGASAQRNFKLLYQFTGVNDGGAPYGSLIADAAGNLYGTTWLGGTGTGCDYRGCGTAFKLTPNLDGSWSESVIDNFTGGSDGGYSEAGLIFDAAGNLYGTTLGVVNDGAVFKLMPNLDGSWSASVLHSFTGRNGGGEPLASLIFDTAGNLYGTTYAGGPLLGGTVFQLKPNPDGSWTEYVLHQFGSKDGAALNASLIFDTAGSLYGTTYQGGTYGFGTVFQLKPNPGGNWTVHALHQFTGGKDGATPLASLTFDAAGNLYSTTSSGGTYGYGTVFQLRPNAGGSWTEHVLHQFTGGQDGGVPIAGVIFDAAGNLDGTTQHEYGAVFQLKPNPDGSWTEYVLHQFTGTDGAGPCQPDSRCGRQSLRYNHSRRPLWIWQRV